MALAAPSLNASSVCAHICTHASVLEPIYSVTKVSILPPTPPTPIFFFPFPGRMVKFVNDALQVAQVLSLAMEIGQ